MFKNVVAKVFNTKEEVKDYSKDEIILEALCAYRDKVIMSENHDFNKLVKIQEAIDEIVLNMPVKS